MINNIIFDGNLFEVNTETNEVKNARPLRWRYVKHTYFIEKAGKLIFPKQMGLEPMDVDANDVIFILDCGTGDKFKILKANYPSMSNALDDIDAKYEKQRVKDLETCALKDTCD